MEDVEFFRRLRRSGRVVCSEKRIVVSPRRYEEVGRARLTFAYGFIAALYVCRVPLSVLARVYQRTCCARKSTGSRPCRRTEVQSSLFTRAVITEIARLLVSDLPQSR